MRFVVELKNIGEYQIIIGTVLLTLTGTVIV
jgi:hypothetical protein